MSKLDRVRALGAGAYRFWNRGVLFRELEGKSVGFDLLVVKVVRGGNEVVLDDILRRELLLQQTDLPYRLKEEVPRLDVVPAPTLASLPIATIDIGQLPHRGDGVSLLFAGERLIEGRLELLDFVSDLGRGSRVVMSELEAHRPAAQVLLIDFVRGFI